MFKAVRGLSSLVVGVAALTPIMYAAGPSTGSETVFVMTNNANKNEVLAYQRLFDGRLVLNERYATGGRGSGGLTDPLQSQGSLTLSQDRSILFAINSGSGTISSFHLIAGLLLPIDQQPTGGSEPVAVAQHQGLVYVLNAGGSGSVVAFRLDSIGHLQEIPNSTVYLTAAHSGGSSITISPDGQFLVVTERIANNIDTFRINADGTLAPIVVNTSVTPGVFSAAFTTEGKLVVSENQPGNNSASTISSYTVTPDGNITAITQSLRTLGDGNCWNALTPDGKYVYVSNSATATIAGFSIGAGGALTPIGGTILGSNPAGSINLDIAVSGDGKYLYSINSGTGTVSIFRINADGSLTSLGDISGLPKTVGFNGIAAL